MDVKRGLRNSILLPTLTYGAENWTWNGAQLSKVCAVEMSYLRGACGVNRWDGLSNESVYERCGMRGRGVVEWVKGSTLRWFGHIERMGNEEFVKKVYLRGACGVSRWDGLSNESVYERCGMRGRGVVEWVKGSTLRWFGHIERKENGCLEG